MLDLPASVFDCLHALTYHERAVAFLRIDAGLILAGLGGHLQNYGLENLRLGEPAVEQAFFLEGLLPLVETPYFVPSVELPGGRVADLHFHLQNDMIWVVLLDVTAERDATRRMQQKAYEMTLLQEKEAILNRRLEAANAALEQERARSERLLLNILPAPIAERLKAGEEYIVNTFEEVTVMFADLVGFTSLAQEMPPALLVRLLDQIFCEFDEIAGHHGLEKIKTIGDSYMAAAGLPYPLPDHAVAAAHMALDMQQAINRINRENDSILSLRIGLCTGPVIAGVIGRNKFIYDLWGDTVNTASRMESHGEPGRTQVAETTYRLLRGHFNFERRGAIKVKGKGSMKTYFLGASRGTSLVEASSVEQAAVAGAKHFSGSEPAT
jgi:class 3 adenylate cyclase